MEWIYVELYVAKDYVWDEIYAFGVDEWCIIVCICSGSGGGGKINDWWVCNWFIWDGVWIYGVVFIRLNELFDVLINLNVLDDIFVVRIGSDCIWVCWDWLVWYLDDRKNECWVVGM